MRSRALKPGRLRLAGNRWRPRLQCNRLLSLHISACRTNPGQRPSTTRSSVATGRCSRNGSRDDLRAVLCDRLIHATQPSGRCALLPRTGATMKPRAPGRHVCDVSTEAQAARFHKPFPRKPRICPRAAQEHLVMPPTKRGSGWERDAVRTAVPTCRTSQEHQLPLSTCHVRSGPWTTWSLTGPDWTVAPRPWRPTSSQPRAGTPTTPPCWANQAAAATGVGWPPRSDTSDSANADPFAQAGLVVAAVTGTAGPAGAAAG